MSEERIRQVQEPLDPLGDLTDDAVERVQTRLGHSGLSSWELNRADLDPLRKRPGPTGVARRRATRTGEAEEPDARLSVRASVGNPHL